MRVHFEEFIDEATKVRGGAMHHGEGLAQLGAQGTLEQEAREPEHGVKRRAELVGHAAQKLGLGTIGGVCLAERLLERRGALFHAPLELAVPAGKLAMGRKELTALFFEELFRLFARGALTLERSSGRLAEQCLGGWGGFVGRGCERWELRPARVDSCCVFFAQAHPPAALASTSAVMTRTEM
jgi:hypothetical protein